jgi:hypothetical protein
MGRSTAHGAAGPLHWSPLARGRYTGLDWSSATQREGHDPYLMWAEAVGPRAHGRPGALLEGGRLNLLIELSAGTTVARLAQEAGASLRIPQAYLWLEQRLGHRLGFCTALADPTFFARYAELKPLIHRFELSRARPGAVPDQVPNSMASAAPEASVSAVLQGPVLGLIDGGLAFAHPRFRQPAAAGGATRIAHFWRQDETGAGRRPAGFAYGFELSGSDIDAEVRRSLSAGVDDESAVYRRLQGGLALEQRVNHGTFVLDIAAGPREFTASVAGLGPDQAWDPLAPPSWQAATDLASRCPIVAVQLDWATVKDTSGGSMRAHLLDGLLYILSNCAPQAEVVVNMSWGTLAGPHDGSSLFERALDELVSLWPGRLSLVLPTSNAYQARTHGNATLAPGEHCKLRWRCSPGDTTQNFLEIWLPREVASGLSVTLRPPGREALPTQRLGDAGVWAAPDGLPLAASIFLRQSARGEHDSCLLLALAPTFSLQEEAPTAPAGLWEICLCNEGAVPVTFDAFIERDDALLGWRSGLTQSHLEDAAYDASQRFDTHPGQSSPVVRRSGTFNSIATGARVHSVGGTRLQASPAEHWARYSAPQPDPDAPRPAHSHRVVKVPTDQAVSDENPVLQGLRAAGTRAGATVRLVGTSSAAPQVARRLLNQSGSVGH